jgi:hypothetical protein
VKKEREKGGKAESTDLDLAVVISERLEGLLEFVALLLVEQPLV